jgi:hypothetical protein
MGKWLAALGAILLVVLILLWRQLDSSSAAPPAPPVERPEPAGPVASAPSTPEEEKPAAKPVEPAGPPPSVVMTKPAESGEKWDPQSDEFFHKHDEIVVPQLMRSAVKCWENLPPTKRAEFHRNQSMTAKFKQRIRNGVVTIYDVEVERSSIGDPALEACFLQQIRGTTWTNSRLPDWDQDDQIKLGPRTLKKYTRENIEADGPEAPRQ